MNARIILMIALSVFSAQMAFAKYTIITSAAPPFVSEDAKSGISIDIVKEMFKRTGIEYEFKTAPLVRALHQAKNKKEHCVVPVQRSQERETSYKWISPILVTQSTLFSTKDSDIDLSVLLDAKEYKIGALRGSDEEEYLQGHGYEQVETVSKEVGNVRKLSKNRIDLWATDSILGPYYAHKADLSVKQQIVFRSTLRALACHIDTSDQTVDKLTKSLKAMYSDGTVKSIFTKYTKDLEIGEMGQFLN